MAERGVSTTRAVTGDVVLAAPVKRAGTRLRVLIEDVSRVDGAARVVAEAVLILDAQHAAGEQLPFALTVIDPNPAARYSVRAHLDANDSGETSEGDQISIAAHPVLETDASEPVRVMLAAI